MRVLEVSGRSVDERTDYQYDDLCFRLVHRYDQDWMVETSLLNGVCFQAVFKRYVGFGR